MKYIHTQSGFSLIETLVAITILLIVIVGPLSITSTTARSTSFASDQVTAFFLAQEGLELVQKVRDDLLLLQFTSPVALNDPWSRFMNTSGNSTNAPLRLCHTSVNATGCGLEILNDANGSLITPIECQTNGAPCRIFYDETTTNKRSRYTHTSANAASTPFTRRIRIERITDYEVRVISEVTWRSGLTSTEQRVSVVNHLFNIYAN